MDDLTNKNLRTTWSEPFKQISRRHITVVGGGIIGLSTAYAAAVRGQGRIKVSLYEADQVGHKGAASTDMNRVFRYLNGPDTTLTIWAKEASSLWEYISHQAGQSLFHRTGVLLLVHKQGNPAHQGHHIWPYNDIGVWVDESVRNLEAEGVPYQRLNRQDLTKRFPQFRGDDIEEAILDHKAGYLEAQSALRVLLDLCMKAGVNYYPYSPVQRLTSDAKGCLIQLKGGEEIRSDAAVVTLNGWTGDLLPLPTNTLNLAEQPIIYLLPPNGTSGLSEGELPVFISLNTDCYGFPVNKGILKVGDDNPYRPIAHPNQRREPDKTYIERVIKTVAQLVPSLENSQIVRTHVCFYDRSKDERFILDAWDNDARIVYGCGMSGRAFKFGPIIGERLARFAVTGERPPDLESFRIR